MEQIWKTVVILFFMHFIFFIIYALSSYNLENIEYSSVPEFCQSSLLGKFPF